MRKLFQIIVLGFGLSLVGLAQAADQHIRPFVLGSVSTGDFMTKVQQVETALKGAGFSIVGTYSPDMSKFHPYQAATVVVVTSPALQAAAAKTSHGGYGAVLSVSVTQVDGKLQVAYMNPIYMSYAYRMKTDLQPVLTALGQAIGDEKTFGAKGMTPGGVENYHYTWGMEYFNEPLHLNTYSTHAQAVAAVKKGLTEGKGHTRFVYQVNVPGTNQTVFGVGLDNPGNGNANDAYIMSVVDYKALKHTAYLPYQILVVGNKVEALNLRFRLAVFFPELAMMGGHSFMTLMPAPNAIKDALTKAAGGSVSSGSSLFNY
ncbi:hypothetical protein BW247_06400 [Acidihalobacter ferrooxydans]|uniref:DUF302 domain-containing protein n=2 Tax=Acidihalobacter ferrooxydans TaxID=1765967 RepID=A0A1P8UL85_9GAMM|nr:hypothetical protein BW247_06400 [Acidihalobacter ferrooxydans]